MEHRRPVLTVDARRRVSLGRLAEHGYYLAHTEADGTIVLTPATVLAVAETAVAE